MTDPLSTCPNIQEMPIELLYVQYQNAIKSCDVDNILKFGELYFAGIHNGEMTQVDKEQLQNDILLCAAAKKDMNKLH